MIARKNLPLFGLVLLLLTGGAFAGDRNMNPDRALRHAKLAAVKTWFYLLDFDVGEPLLKKISGSAYDMVVIEPVFTEKENTGYDIAAAVRRLKQGHDRRLVLAYIDIGEAEEWRSYWQTGWRIGHPSWIVADDPDGWEGNYPVAYWHEDWRRIWLGKTGIIRALVRAGFDGVYLDWVEAYSDENVIHAARRDKVDPRAEMIRFIGDLAVLARAGKADFLVIAQNAAELAGNRGYARIIDGIAQEQVWFDGGADNDPPGDCPLPATEADIESRAYVHSLSRKCRRQHDRFEDSTLHVSSQSYIEALKRAQGSGLVIFTVDYALQKKNSDRVYKMARRLGFVPYVGERALATFRPARP